MGGSTHNCVDVLLLVCVANSAGLRLALQQYASPVFNFQALMGLGPTNRPYRLLEAAQVLRDSSRTSTVEDDIHDPPVDKWWTARLLNVAVLVTRLRRTICWSTRVKVVLCRPLPGRFSTSLVSLYF